MSEPLETGSRVESVDDLLLLGDADFVKAAYRQVLGREADPDGLAHYLKQVRLGTDKAALVATLALSDEGRQRSFTLAGLAELARHHVPEAPSLARRIARRLLAPLRRPSTEPLERIQRAMDNRLWRLDAAIAAQTLALAELQAEISRLSITVGNLGRISPPAHLEAAAAGAAPVADTACDAVPREAPPRVESLLRAMLRMRRLRSTQLT